MMFDSEDESNATDFFQCIVRIIVIYPFTWGRNEITLHDTSVSWFQYLSHFCFLNFSLQYITSGGRTNINKGAGDVSFMWVWVKFVERFQSMLITYY